MHTRQRSLEPGRTTQIVSMAIFIPTKVSSRLTLYLVYFILQRFNPPKVSYSFIDMRCGVGYSQCPLARSTLSPRRLYGLGFCFILFFPWTFNNYVLMTVIVRFISVEWYECWHIYMRSLKPGIESFTWRTPITRPKFKI